MRYFKYIALLLSLLLLCSCAARPTGPQPAESAAPTEAALPTEAETETETEPKAECNIDLVGLNAYDAFDAVFEIMDNAPEYVGQRIRMTGVFDVYEYPDHLVYGCIIPDPTDNCRPQGMEFVLREEPETLPRVGDEIVVSGVFELYEMGEFTFCHLVDAVLEPAE